MTTSPRERPPQGLTVDGYRIIARLGEGGMGVVHLAQRPGGERVALKVLRPHVVGDDEARERLAREVNSLSRVRSRLVAEILDADPWGDIPYVATRYVPGLSLHDDVRQEGPLAGEDLRWFAACLADALAAVHATGVLHRDIKPSNVLMEGRTPVLIDFGLARLADDPRLTQTGWLLGTPGYLAPEILHGEDATAASDVHSWAATVAYAGTGRPPFGRGPSMAIMDRVRRGEHDLSGLDPALVDLVADALDPDPRRRPTLPEVRGWLAEGLDEADLEEPDDLDHPDDRDGAHRTVPLSLAAVPPADATTQRFDDPPDRPERQGWPEREGWDEPVPPAPRRVGVLERLRRAGLLLGGLAAATAGLAAAPYVALVVLLLTVWLLRSGSLATSAASRRRLARGIRWYDVPQALLAAPWHLLAAVPGALLLALWSAGLAAAAALLCFALALSFTASLGVVALTFVGALWWGPGSLRLRSPVGRVVRPLAARPVPWFLVTMLVLALAAGLGSLVLSTGTSWAPAADRPFSGVELPDGGILGR